MFKLIAAIAASLALAIPAAANADPFEGDGCTTVNNQSGTVVTLPAPDYFGCDYGAGVEITTWWSDTRDENGCNAWGRTPHGVCIGG